MTAENERPNVWQRCLYGYGKRLPDSMREWVRNDLVGKGATRRMLITATIPCVLLLVPLALIPTTWDVRVSMTLPILIPFVYFAVALNKIWRRHRLSQHGLDPHLIDQAERARDEHIHQAYRDRYGPRSD